jgi:hypothetical protein
MSALAISLGVFAVVLVGASVGGLLRGVLPPHHVTDHSKEVIKLGTALISTLSVLVLGLLVASAKSSYDVKSAEIQESAARIILLDRNLRQYGPEAAPVRQMVQRVAEYRVNANWLATNLQTIPRDARGSAPGDEGIEDIHRLLSALVPVRDAQTNLRSRAMHLTHDLAQARWLLLEQAGSSTPAPFLVVLVFWLAVIFGSLGLFAPRNATVYSVIFVCALSASSAIFLIIEMDRPFQGLLRIPDAPLSSAIAELNRQD